MADPQSRSGRGYLDPAILDFVAQRHAPHDAALEAAYRAPEREANVPAIQVGPSEGKLLAFLVGLSQARRVVEIGTLVGYSGLWMARALPDGGRLWTLEHDAHHAALARQHFTQAGLSDRVEVVEGAAQEALPSLEAQGPFDLVFLDADKEGYPGYAQWAIAHLRPGGLIVADNVFLFGRLLETDATAQAMRRFHDLVASRFDSVCIPTPDGLLVGALRA